MFSVDPARISSLHDRFIKLEKLGEAPEGALARARGNDFEDLLLDLFDAHGILLRRAFHTSDNRAEQIDGAVDVHGRVALVEAKWTSVSLAASELFAFLGKVEGKFVGTIGIFVSRTELSGNFLNALRAGRRQSIIVIHGDDVPALFQPNFSLSAYLQECVRHVSIDNAPHLAVAQFLTRKRMEDTASKEQSKATSTLMSDLSSAQSASLISALQATKNHTQLEQEVVSLLQAYPRVLLHEPQTSPLRTTIPAYVESAIKKLPQSDTDADRLFFEQLFDTALSEPAYGTMIGAFAPRLSVVSEPVRTSAEQALRSAWDTASGDYGKENSLASPTEVLWNWLSDDFKRFAFHLFIEFINSHRRPNFPQYALARKKLIDPKNRDLRNEVLREALLGQIAHLRSLEEDDAWVRKWVLHAFDTVRKLLGSEFDEVANQVTKPSDDSGNDAPDAG